MQIVMVFRRWFFDIPHGGPEAAKAWSLVKNCFETLKSENYSDYTQSIIFNSDGDIPKQLMAARASFRGLSRVGELDEELGLLRHVKRELVKDIADYVGGLTPEQRQRLAECFRTPNVLLR